MNNLKFRAYIKSIQMIVDVVEIDLKNKMATLDIATNKVDPDFSFWWKETELPFSQVIIMQSTGLFDKNGVEIFEGDIVRTYGNDYTPIYSKGIYMALNVSQIKFPKENWSFSTQFNIVWRDGGEVIGNIYENKELLENE